MWVLQEKAFEHLEAVGIIIIIISSHMLAYTYVLIDTDDL